MSDCPPSGASEGAVVNCSQALTPQAIENILADFRLWLTQLVQASPAPSEPVRDDELEPIDLFTLLGQMTALRQEVHLQTRAVRVQQEQNAATLDQLAGSLQTLQETQELSGRAEPPSEDEVLRPLLKTLVDLYDALALAAREVLRVQEMIASREISPWEIENADGEAAPGDSPQSLQQLIQEWEEARAQAKRPVAAASSPGLLGRLFGRTEQAADLTAQHSALAAAERTIAALNAARLTGATPLDDSTLDLDLRESQKQVRPLLESLVMGYTMSLQRVERALRQHELEPIPSVGQSFDPEIMEVLEAATGTGRPSGEVVDEIRRGYLWRGRLFRCVQVRVARS